VNRQGIAAAPPCFDFQSGLIKTVAAIGARALARINVMLHSRNEAV